jgi:orotate phosphoribosyltransferase
VVVLIDRQKESATPFSDYGYQLHSIFVLDDLLEYYERNQLIPAEMIERCRQYLRAD